MYFLVVLGCLACSLGLGLDLAGLFLGYLEFLCEISLLRHLTTKCPKLTHNAAINFSLLAVPYVWQGLVLEQPLCQLHFVYLVQTLLPSQCSDCYVR